MLWLELEQQWPDFVWDVWARTPEVSRARHTLVPEVPRTHHIGRGGTSMHLVDFDKWFSPMLLQEEVDWSLAAHGDLSHELALHTYEDKLALEVAKSTPVDNFWDIYNSEVPTTFTMCYAASLWRLLAQYLGLWPPVPLEGLPLRGLTFNGVTRFRWATKGGGTDVTHTVLLVPQSSILSSGHTCVTEGHLDSYLPPSPRHTLPNNLRVRSSERGESCALACASRGMWCSPDVLAGGYGGYISNGSESEEHLSAISGCAMMVETFGAQCMGGCVAVANEEATPAERLLPCLWHEDGGAKTTCLVSPISPPALFDCARSMPEVERLCPCSTLAGKR